MGKQSETKEGTNKLVNEARLFVRILGFFLIFYGLLVFIDPSSYALGIPETYSPLLGFLLMAFGVFLVMTKGVSRRGR